MGSEYNYNLILYIRQRPREGLVCVPQHTGDSLRFSFFTRTQCLCFPSSSFWQRVNVNISTETWSGGVSIAEKSLLPVPRNLLGIPLSSGECHLHDSSLGQCYCLSFNRWKALKFRKMTWLTQGFMVYNSKIRVQASVPLDQNSVLSLYIFQDKTFVSNTVCACVVVTQLCLTLCDPVGCSPQPRLLCGILQARILKWVAVLFSRGSSWPRNRTQVSCTAWRFFTVWARREVHLPLLS